MVTGFCFALLHPPIAPNVTTGAMWFAKQAIPFPGARFSLLTGDKTLEFQPLPLSKLTSLASQLGWAKTRQAAI